MAVSYIGYEVDVSDLERILDEIDAQMQLSNGELMQIAQRAAFMIRTRTAQGRDYQGLPFEEYSEIYAEFRDDTGRNVSPVDLLYEGHMLASMTAFTDGSDAIVGFSSAAEARKANWHNEGTKHMPQRRFLDIDEEGQEAFQLASMAAEFMAARIESLG